MSDLAALLQAAAARRCSAVTSWRQGSKWECNVRHADGGWSHASGEDLVAALTKALSAATGASVVSEVTDDTGNQDIFG
jgi:hypothetical protein